MINKPKKPLSGVQPKLPDLKTNLVAQHINQYQEYCNLVGDNGGVMMSEKQYAQYKKSYAQKAENRLYTTWYNPEGLACKIVGPASKCFCDHPYKNHDFLEGTKEKVKCKLAGCKCPNFFYVPIYGSQDFKCTCKHSYQNHDAAKKSCSSCQCKLFASSWACTCGHKSGQHKTVSQYRQEKEQKGQTVGYKQGGVVSYSSMLDGVQRFGHGIKEQIKARGLKVQIEQFLVSGQQVLGEDVSAWQLLQTPLKSWK